MDRSLTSRQQPRQIAQSGVVSDDVRIRAGPGQFAKRLQPIERRGEVTPIHNLNHWPFLHVPRFA